MARVAAKFGRHLLTSPQMISTLVPPFIPRQNALARCQSLSNQAEVVGIKNETWSDHLCTFFYSSREATAIASGHFTFAVGLSFPGLLC